MLAATIDVVAAEHMYEINTIKKRHGSSKLLNLFRKILL